MAEWQCVMVVWGTRYPVAVINNLAAAVLRHAANAPRLVLVAEHPLPGLMPGILVRPFPAFFLAPAFRGGGCQAKLALFEAGVVPPDLPAVYVDLDTVVVGDLQRAVRRMRSARSILLLQSTLLAFGPVPRWLWRISGGRRYARGNSSVMAYHPGQCGYVAARFRVLWAARGGAFKPLWADERFISWVAQADAMVMPGDIAVKFPGEFMSRVPGWLPVKARLPWVRARRDGLAAVTLCGDAAKPEVLMALADGARLADRRGRWLEWSDRSLGAMRGRIRAFYAGIY